MKRKFLSVILCLCMVVTLMPATALAADPSGEDGEDRVSVIIEMEDEPVLSETADATRSALIAGQAALQSEIHSSIDSGAEFSYAYTSTLNGFQADVRKSDIDSIQALPGVKSVYSDTVYYVPETSEVSLAGASDTTVTGGLCNVAEAWDLGYKGEGTVVAVIGTGIDSDHPYMVLSDSTTPALMREDVAGKLSQLSMGNSFSADDVYVNEKFPFQFDYAGGDCNAEADSDHPSGVHTAGVIAANGSAAGMTDDLAFDGVAPEAQIAGMLRTTKPAVPLCP